MKISNARKMVKNFFSDVKEFSFSVAFGRVIRDLPIFKWEFRQHFYENKIKKYIKKKYQKKLLRFIRDYDGSLCCKADKIIWVMWWQGVNSMPPVVRACYERLLKVSDRKVVLITKDNFTDFVHLPEYVLNKVNNGQITLTHFSDILRSYLLYNYGGFWCDATIWVDRIPEVIDEFEFYTLKAKGWFPVFISRGEWSPFLLVCNKTGGKLPFLLYNLFLEYWSKHIKLIDYLLIDYFILFIKNNDKGIDALFTVLPENRDYYSLNLAINEPYDEKAFLEKTVKSPFQKLTYKKEMKEKTDKGELSNYGYLLKSISYE